MRDDDSRPSGCHQQIRHEAASALRDPIRGFGLPEHEQVGMARVQRRDRGVARLRRTPFDNAARTLRCEEKLLVRAREARLGSLRAPGRRSMRKRQLQSGQIRIEAFRQVEREREARRASLRIVEVDEQALVAHGDFP